MRYRPFESYGRVEAYQFAKLPSHWSIRRTKTMLRLRKTRAGNSAADHTLLSLTLRGVVPRNIADGGKLPADFGSYQLVGREDLVFCLFDIDETPRTIGISREDGIITGAYSVYQTRPACAPDYAYYYFLHIDYSKGLRPFYSGLRKVVRADTFSRIEMPCPPLEEQTQIAKFLDYETAKIDALIEKQQQLIALLKEKRQAVISHAVTKGLNPDAPMRDSGIEWLGEVPAHWSVLKGAWLGQLFGSESIPEDQIGEEGGLLFIKVSSLSLTDFSLAERRYFVSTAHSRRVTPRTNFIVFPKRGAAIFTNKVNIVREPAVLDPNLMGWLPNERIKPEFLSHVLKLRGLEDIADISTVPQINNKHLTPMKFAVPPIDEQEEILDRLLPRLETLKELLTSSETQIELLQERRTALISAAVTGKIDVRGWKPPETSAEQSS